MIRLEALSFAYPGGGEIFSGFDWEVERSHSWAVLGPSGCGKTTLLYLLAGLNLAERGAVMVDGQKLTRPRPQTGLVLQDYGLLPWSTVEENISLGLRIRQFYGPDGLHAPRSPAPDGRRPAPEGALHPESADLEAWLRRLGLEGLEHKYPGSLSGGQRQRVAIARTLILQPDLLLMDEPFSSLDAPTRQGLEELTLQLWLEQRFTFVVVTHAIEEAAILGQHVLVLGKPPHRSPIVFHNSVFDQPDARDSEPYRELCRNLRACLEGA